MADEKHFEYLVEAAGNAAQSVARQILAEHGGAITRKERLRVATVFRRVLIPPRRVGRPPSERITAAHRDWLLGLRGVELYRKHIQGFARMNRWRRQGESRMLMDAIRARERRNRLHSQDKCVLAA